MSQRYYITTSLKNIKPKRYKFHASQVMVEDEVVLLQILVNEAHYRNVRSTKL